MGLPVANPNSRCLEHHLPKRWDFILILFIGTQMDSEDCDSLLFWSPKIKVWSVDRVYWLNPQQGVVCGMCRAVIIHGMKEAWEDLDTEVYNCIV